MPRYDQLRTELLALFSEVTRAAEAREAPETSARLRAEEERLAEGRLTVVLCGEFKRGKSTLLNALLDQRPGLAPTDTVIATRLVTVVGHGETERITVVLAGEEGEDPVRRVITREEIADYVTESGNPHNVRRALLLEAELPHPLLASGVVIADTPGTGGQFGEHSLATEAFLPRAHALLVVFDCTQPLTAAELAFVAEAVGVARVGEDGEGLLCVLTKADLVADPGPLVEDARAKLAEATGLPPAALTVLPVSAQAKLDHLAGGAPEDLELSNVPALEAALWAALARRRATVLLGAAVTALDAALAALLAPVDAALAAVGQGREEELARLRAQYRDAQGRLTDLAAADATWRGELRADFRKVRSDLLQQARREHDRVWLKAHADYLDKEEYLENPDALVRKIAADTVAVAGAVSDEAERRAAAVLKDFAERSEIALALAGFPRLPDPPVPFLDISGKSGTVDQPTGRLARFRATMAGIGTGGAVGAGLGGSGGALIGTFFLPIVGTWVGGQLGAWAGAAVGALAGWRAAAAEADVELRKQQRRALRAALKEELAPLRTDQLGHLRAGVEELVHQLSAGAVAELESRIAQERESIGATVRRLEAESEATVEDAEKRHAALTEERAPLQRARDRVADLAARAAGLDG
ncbi:dynamin family protein [Streptomyces sp. DSM 44917]|uniref:Dynamin family protein n=1 Tax=Streptomyces boetiae TaxID=3075541 RepID=A0ABU2L8X3_9ACTN|nr:dynamin family protein [Streptomyces sp. DSM 44917]MDT0308016.1 dynamin family protein [Streptomyces sp. DSM 44917]